MSVHDSRQMASLAALSHSPSSRQVSGPVSLVRQHMLCAAVLEQGRYASRPMTAFRSVPLGQ